MSHTYAILGAGMQGTAAAYDLARFAENAQILIADSSLEQAQRSAARVNLLTGKQVCRPRELEALDPKALGELLQPVDVLLSSVPYWMHPAIARVAIDTGTHMCDLGGNTEVTMETLALDEAAKAANVTLVPDTGLAPGFVNSVGMYLVGQFDEPDTVRLYCGVLPQHPKPPFNYKLTFNVEGLVTEYDYQAVVLRNGEVTLVDTLAELEEIEIEGLGVMEAFTTSGGTSTAPYTLQGKLKNYEYKTIRFPGHCDRMRIFKDFGFWGEEPLEVDGASVTPRHLFYKVFGTAMKQYADVDQCIVRGVGSGKRRGEQVRVQVDVHDKQCAESGFTAMERLTGFSIAIHAIEAAEGRLAVGALRYETAMDPALFLEQVARRGISLKFSEQSLKPPSESLIAS